MYQLNVDLRLNYGMARMNRSLDANYFHHTSDKNLTDSCISYIESIIGRNIWHWDYYRKDERPTLDSKVMSGGTFLDIMLHIFTVDDHASFFRYLRNYDPIRSSSLDEYLFRVLIVNEIDFLRRQARKIYRDKLGSYVSCQKLVAGVLSDDNIKIFHDYRHEFLASYLNSFVKGQAEKFHNAISASLLMSLDNCTIHGYLGLNCYSGEGLQLALHHNVACKLNIIEEVDFYSHIERFEDDDIKNFLLVDFLAGDPGELALLANCRDWLEYVNESVDDRDVFFGEWMLEMCLLYFAFHLNAEKLKSFIDNLLDPVFHFFDYSERDYKCIKDMLYKQSLIIEPSIFVGNGFSSDDFLYPLHGSSKSAERSLKYSKLFCRYSPESNDSWLALPIVSQILKQSGMTISANDINNCFSPTSFQRALLSHIKPKGYFENFMEAVASNKGSIPSLRKMANELVEEASGEEVKLSIQNAYLEMLVGRSQDKPLMDKKVGLVWVNRRASVEHLRNKNLLGLYSAVSLFELSIDDFKQDYHLLTSVSKRNLLANSLDL